MYHKSEQFSIAPENFELSKETKLKQSCLDSDRTTRTMIALTLAEEGYLFFYCIQVCFYYNLDICFIC